LGLGVTVTAQRTLQAPSADVPLGLPSSRIPYRDYNDPRRLLLGARCQQQAYTLACATAGGEMPLVRAKGDDLEPPGVNLRVAYLAYRGLNHEDAWVISRSAAAKLRTCELRTYWVLVRRIESPPEMLVKVGDRVRAKKPLLERQIIADLLRPAIGPIFCVRSAVPRDGFAAVPEAQDLAPEPGDLADGDGLVLSVRRTDLDAMRQTGRYVISDRIRTVYRSVIRIRIRHESPLRVGCKLANRHGHKGIVGAIVEDKDMPRWRDKPLEALIDPISVINRSNLGQLHETLRGAEIDAEQNRQTDFMVTAASGADWPGQATNAIAGLQFVMRIPTALPVTATANNGS